MKFKKLKLIVSTLFLLLFSFIAKNASAEVANTGKEFYVTFGQNTNITSVAFLNGTTRDTVQMQLRVTATANAQVKLHFAANAALDTTFSVAQGQIYDYTLTYNQAVAAYCGLAYNVNNSASYLRSIQVTSTAPINLVALNVVWASIEASAIFPVEKLGMNYYHVGMTPAASNSNGFVIIATEDNTKVDFSGPVTIPSVTLNKGWVYQYNSMQNPTGTIITASKPVAYFQNTTNGVV